MTTVYESDVVRAIRGFKAALRAQEGAQMHLLATRYLDVERALDSFHARYPHLGRPGLA